jgi:hypothetical protein
MPSFYELTLFLFEQPPPADARALAQQHLGEIRSRIELALKAQDIDTMTQAHLQELREKIDKTLKASLQVNEP